jgi:hypothetical protein
MNHDKKMTKKASKQPKQKEELVFEYWVDKLKEQLA